MQEHDILNRNPIELLDWLRGIRRDLNRLPVLGLENNPHPRAWLDSILDLVREQRIFVLLPDFAHEIRNIDHAHPWPTWPIIQQLENDSAPSVVRDPQYRMTFLSGLMRYHRLYLAQRLRTCLTDQDLVIANRLCPENYINTFRQPCDDLSDFIADLPWSNHPDRIDVDQNSGTAKDILSVSMNPAYDTCLNITGESDPTNGRVCLSEKTWKAYWAGCLVVNYGSDIAPSWLRKQGFEIIDGIDPCCDFQQKSQIILDLMDNIDIRDLYHRTREQRSHNQNLVRSRQWLINLAAPAIEKIKSLF